MLNQDFYIYLNVYLHKYPSFDLSTECKYLRLWQYCQSALCKFGWSGKTPVVCNCVLRTEAFVLSCWWTLRFFHTASIKEWLYLCGTSSTSFASHGRNSEIDVKHFNEEIRFWKNVSVKSNCDSIQKSKSASLIRL